MPKLSERVGTFTDSVIRRMTRISDEYDAINLSQGFPDFDPPQEIMEQFEDMIIDYIQDKINYYEEMLEKFQEESYE